MRMLFTWAYTHKPEAYVSIADNLDKRDYCLRCLGGIFRAAVKHDPPWLWKIIDCDARQVIELSPYIRPIPWADIGHPDSPGDIPGRIGWREWIKAADVAGWLSWGPCPPHQTYAEQRKAEAEYIGPAFTPDTPEHVLWQMEATP